MARTSKSSYALLGLLTICPASGYDLRKLLEVSLNHFWRESYGQIYPTLKRLQREGLVIGEKEAQEGRPDRTVYRITSKGEEVFRAWLKEPAAPQPPRNELLLKLFFGTHLTGEEVLEQLHAFQTEQRERLETFRGIESWLRAEYAGAAELPYWLATVSYGQFEADALLRWCEKTLRTLGLQEEAIQ
jgi:DNA-binding PadR family transcriptional regulator